MFTRQRLALIAPMVSLARNPGLHFSSPSFVGTGCDFVAGFRSLGDGALIGQCGHAWLGSSDGGRSWSPAFDGKGVPPMVLPMLSADGLHDIGSLTINTTDPLANYTQLLGTSPGVIRHRENGSLIVNI